MNALLLILNVISKAYLIIARNYIYTKLPISIILIALNSIYLSGRERTKNVKNIKLCLFMLYNLLIAFE